MASHNMLVSFAYVLARAAHGRDVLSVLDWGGGLGHYAVLARAVLPEVTLDWHCREMPSVASAGARVNPDVTFHTDDACLEQSYDVVLASSSLQYAPDWQALLRRLARATSGFLLVTRLPIALEARSFVVLQRAQGYGYATEYLGWVVSRDELLAEASAAGLGLDRELLLDAWLSAAEAPEDPVGHRGFLFRPSVGG
jgi:putative methyltransferase (TIGR04325 family)